MIIPQLVLNFTFFWASRLVFSHFGAAEHFLNGYVNTDVPSEKSHHDNVVSPAAAYKESCRLSNEEFANVTRPNFKDIIDPAIRKFEIRDAFAKIKRITRTP